MADTLQLVIITPEREFFRGEATFVEFTTTDGDVGIYPRHIPTTVVLDPGILRIHTGKDVREAALHSGFAEILGDRITILAEAVEWPEEIDKNRAEEARIRAERKLEDSAADGSKAELALKRSVLRIHMAEKEGR
ncbi:MAG: ATP synthase F1 subunit epsilon [Eubacterium sp.]|nr:ATP synthase F1 subunit epsilon [Eubacterium sp.]